MLNYSFIFVFLILFIIKNSLSQFVHKVNYTISSEHITLIKCDSENKSLIFRIEAKINPRPYCDISFILPLKKPNDKNVNCLLKDDEDEKIECTLSFTDCPLKKSIIHIEEQNIIVNNDINIRIVGMTQIEDVNCNKSWLKFVFCKKVFFSLSLLFL